MTRLHADPVEVHTRTEPAGPAPDQFLWRGRLYVVLEVLARWTESGAWWRGAAMTALTSGEPGAGAGAAAGASAAAAADTGARAGAVELGAGPVGVDDRERSWWRVEAGSGRASASSGGTGVYDLCFDEARGTWSLARVQD